MLGDTDIRRDCWAYKLLSALEIHKSGSLFFTRKKKMS